MPFREIPHTADLCLHVQAVDLPGLFAEAARGMYTISGVHGLTSPPIPRIYQHAAVDKESLLVAFLSELIYYLEHEQISFDQFDLDLSERSLVARMEGSHVSGLNKNIKAVTYHNLEIISTASGFEVDIVFDV